MRAGNLLWILFTAAAAFCLGLVFGKFAADAPSELREENRRLTAETQRSIGEKQPAASLNDLNPAPSADWGLLAGFPERFGPGSAFLRFATSLERDGIWDRQGTLWTIEGADSESARAYLMLTQTGDGKIFMEAIANVGVHHDPMWVTVVFKPDLGPIEAGVKNRDRVILGVAKGLELSAGEKARLETVLRLLPLHFGTQAQIDQCMLLFVRSLPERVVRRFAECLSCYADPQTAERSKISLHWDVPAVGFMLSERTVAEVAFQATECSGCDYHWEYEKPGPWWSIMIHEAADTSYSSLQEPEKKADGNTWLRWPRLTTAEIDRLR